MFWSANPIKIIAQNFINAVLWIITQFNQTLEKVPMDKLPNTVPRHLGPRRDFDLSFWASKIP